MLIDLGEGTTFSKDDNLVFQRSLHTKLQSERLFFDVLNDEARVVRGNSCDLQSPSVFVLSYCENCNSYFIQDLILCYCLDVSYYVCGG